MFKVNKIKKIKLILTWRFVSASLHKNTKIKFMRFRRGQNNRKKAFTVVMISSNV